MNELILRELQLHALPLASVTDGDDFSDLMPLVDVLKDVRVVGLGECTHGTREFFQMKHRMTRFLVEKLGFRLFTIEAPILTCQPIDEYARHGKGDAQTALDGQQYWVWNTEEVIDLIEWMRKHNLNCEFGDECGFFGYDIQCSALPELDRLAPRLGPEAAQYIAAATEPYRNIVPGSPRPPIDAPLQLLGYLVTHEFPLAARVGRQHYEQAVTAALILCQGRHPDAANPACRDLFMADNILNLLDKLPAEDKIVIWAHNFHVGSRVDVPTMGWYLRQALQDRYYVFGFTFTEGSFMANTYDDGVRRRRPITVPPPPHGSWGAEFAQISDGDFILNLRPLLQNPILEDWCAEKKDFRSNGAVYNTKEPERFIAHDYDFCSIFDGVIHIQKTSYARPSGDAIRLMNEVNQLH